MWNEFNAVPALGMGLISSAGEIPQVMAGFFRHMAWVATYGMACRGAAAHAWVSRHMACVAWVLRHMAWLLRHMARVAWVLLHIAWHALRHVACVATHACIMCCLPTACH